MQNSGGSFGSWNAWMGDLENHAAALLDCAEALPAMESGFRERCRLCWGDLGRCNEMEGTPGECRAHAARDALARLEELT